MSKNRFNLNRAKVVDENFVEAISDLAERAGANATAARRHSQEALSPAVELTCREAVELLESQITSRMQDIVAREMRARNEGFYTIGSSGHEGNAVVGRLTRYTDMAFLHYRSGAFMAERARQVPDIDFVRDTMLGVAGSTEDPIAGGRHKVWGSAKLNVPPQTSTIASHLPKAVGTALALGRARRLRLPQALPADAIVVCSFGDASSNHATAQSAFNVAALTAHQRLPVPVLFVCEDNGLGISVETPPGWIEAQMRARYGLTYFKADGLDLVDAYRVTWEAVTYCRKHRAPVFLHLRTVRLLGHAGSDPETEYHTWDQIEVAEAHDPVLATARLLIDESVMTPAQVLDLYEGVRTRVRAAAEYAALTPKLASAEEVMATLAPSSPDAVAAEAVREPNHGERVRIFEGEDNLPERGTPRHMAALINLGLHDLLIKYPEAAIFGEDVARKGGVYHVTTGMSAKFGLGRVYNTMLDETTILALAIGAGHLGMLPMPEIQYLAYYHNAEDQIRGEAASLQFFSKDQFRNPMVMRIAGWAYQKGFGGHFHNDNSIAALRDVPGLVIASPSRGDDAVKMMRTCLAMAKVDGRVVAFIEPIALYMTRDLYEPKDHGWSYSYPTPDEAIPLGEGAVYRGELPAGQPSSDEPPAEVLTILTFANGVYMSLRAARRLREAHGVSVRVVDLRWLNPLNESFIVEQALVTGNVLVVDEGRRTGGVGEAVLAVICERCGGPVHATRLTGHDSFIPLGPAADHVLPTEADIVAAVLAQTGTHEAKPAAKRAARPTRRRPTGAA